MLDFLFGAFFHQIVFLPEIIDAFARISSSSTETHEIMISYLIKQNGLHAILRRLTKTQISEEKIKSFVNFLYSISIFPIKTQFQTIFLDDFIECIDSLIQSPFKSSLPILARTVRNLVNCLNEIPDSFFDNFIIDNLFNKMMLDNEEMISYTCISIGIIRYKKDIVINIKPIVELINHSSIKVVISSSWCLAVLSYFDSNIGKEFLSEKYLLILMDYFNNGSYENKIDLSFQIIIFSELLPFQLFWNLGRNGLFSIFAEILNTKSIFLLERLLRLLLNIILFNETNVDNNRNLDFPEFFNEILLTIKDIQRTDSFNELQSTRIPEYIESILSKFQIND